MIEAPKAAPITIKSNNNTQIIQQLPTTQAIQLLGGYIAPIGTVYKQFNNLKGISTTYSKKITTSYLNYTETSMSYTIVSMKKLGTYSQRQH